MSKQHKKLISDYRVISLRDTLKEALNYHYSNFVRLEEQGDPFPENEVKSTERVITRMKANSVIKFEVLAYVIHLRRLKHFIKNVEKEFGFPEPDDPELKQIWGDLMSNDGVINMLANKWAAHRSIDDPKGEEDLLHVEVLLNLDGSTTMWGNGHLSLSLDRHQFYLSHYHSKAMKFVNWVFERADEILSASSSYNTPVSKYQLFRVVTAAVIHDNDKFLLGRRHPKDDNLPDFWSIPAGHIEVTETDINTLEENLKREVKEELDIEIEVEGYLDSHSWIDPEYSKLTVVFLATIKSGEPKTSDEISEVKWYTVEEASSLNLPPNVLRVLQKAQSSVA